jgi:hypothetical protein
VFACNTVRLDATEEIKAAKEIIDHTLTIGSKAPVNLFIYGYFTDG